MFNTRSFKILLLRDAICLSLLYDSNKKPLVGFEWTVCELVELRLKKAAGFFTMSKGTKWTRYHLVSKYELNCSHLA